MDIINKKTGSVIKNIAAITEEHYISSNGIEFRKEFWNVISEPETPTNTPPSPRPKKSRIKKTTAPEAWTLKEENNELTILDHFALAALPYHLTRMSPERAIEEAYNTASAAIKIRKNHV